MGRKGRGRGGEERGEVAPPPLLKFLDPPLQPHIHFFTKTVE